jgi:hypothetical protein
MAHYAKLDENNIVIDVIVIANKNCLDEHGIECEEPGRCLCEALTGHAKWKKTSYNTRRGIHFNSNTGEISEDQSKAYRLNFAQEGMIYDESLDGFVVTENFIKKIFPRMVINPQTGYWSLPKPSIPVPEDSQLNEYPLDTYREPWFWDEYEFEWVKVKNTEQIKVHYLLYGDML